MTVFRCLPCCDFTHLQVTAFCIFLLKKDRGGGGDLQQMFLAGVKPVLLWLYGLCLTAQLSGCPTVHLFKRGPACSLPAHHYMSHLAPRKELTTFVKKWKEDCWAWTSSCCPPLERQSLPCSEVLRVLLCCWVQIKCVSLSVTSCSAASNNVYKSFQKKDATVAESNLNLAWFNTF